MDGISKIVITGPESSGKSWLSERLAKHFKTLWAPEYARIYLEENGPAYTFSTLQEIARAHKKHQQEIIEKAQNLVFLDTDLVNFNIWSRVIFHKTDHWINQHSKEETEHQYLILFPDLPWENDPLREHPDDRQYLFDLHLREIAQLGRPYRIIKGYGECRLKNAIQATKEFMHPDKSY